MTYNKKYMREYREKNREHLKEIQKNYREINREKLRKYSKEWKRKHYDDKRKEYNRKWNREHREQVRKTCMKSYYKNKDRCSFSAKERGQNLKFSVMAIYCEGQPKCQCPKCDETRIEFLTIDHVYGNGNKMRKQIKAYGSGMYWWLKKQDFPEGFRVLCFNCNSALGHFGYCPHEFEHG